MTKAQPNGAPSSLYEKTVSSFMGGDASKGSPQPAKKQTSLLSFFSTPSPKRPVGEISQELPSSPSRKKKVKEETPLIASSSFYEMVSESDEEDQGFSTLPVHSKVLANKLGRMH
jgi:hypothetical protein